MVKYSVTCVDGIVRGKQYTTVNMCSILLLVKTLSYRYVISELTSKSDFKHYNTIIYFTPILLTKSPQMKFLSIVERHKNILLLLPHNTIRPLPTVPENSSITYVDICPLSIATGIIE